MYLYMTDILEHYGYPQYEISNFSLPSKESKHKLKYWRLDDYMAALTWGAAPVAFPGLPERLPAG